MAVISFSNGSVWSGGNRRVCLGLFSACERRLGRRDFLQRFQSSFEHGYNHADFSREDRRALDEFRTCVAELASDPADFAKALGNVYDPSELGEALTELLALIDQDRSHAA